MIKSPVLILAALFFVIAAFLSSGFYHFDEHYQIVEFARYFNHPTQPENLPWEYQARIRPSLQPLMAAGIFKITYFLNPWQQTFCLRIFNATFLFFALFRFTKKWNQGLSNVEQKVNLIWGFLFFLVPFMAARFSAEVFAASCLLLAASFSDNDKNHKTILSGFLAGIAIVVRLQTAPFVLGIGLWYLFVKKYKLNLLVKFLTGVLIALLAGTLSDRLFYGEWCLTPLNYFTVNILQNKAAEFGTQSWYFYFSEPLHYGLLSVLNAIVLSGSIFYFIKYPKDMLTWAIIPFLVLHIGIGHKEWRFLFPVLPFIPFLLAKVLMGWNSKWATMIISGLLCINFPAMVWKSITPANGQPLIYKTMQSYPAGTCFYYFMGKDDLKQQQGGLTMPFYQTGICLKPISDTTSLPAGGLVWLNRTGTLKGFSRITGIIPDFLPAFSQKFRIPLQNCNWGLYQYHGIR